VTRSARVGVPFCTAIGGQMGKYSMNLFGIENEETRAK
jgi:hypothetical protein